jgi:hypothetical protein
VGDLREYARTAAMRNGIDPTYFERQIQQESGFNPRAYNAGSGASGIAQIIERWHPGVDVWNPEASLDYAAGLVAGYLKQTGSYPKALAAYNWGIGNVLGYTHNGVTVPPWDGRRETLPAETQHYLDVILGPGWEGAPVQPQRVVYTPAEPPHIQEEDWDCSQESAEWALWSVGRRPQEDWIEPTMLAEGVVTREWGLMDASGAGLAAFLNRHYGEFGFHASNEPLATFDALASEAGRYPLMIGGRNWGGPGRGHWSGLAEYDRGRDVLVLRNPATGPTFGQAELTREQFNARGPFSMVRLTHPDLMTINEPGPTDPSGPTGPEPPAGQPDLAARVAELEAEVGRLKTVVGFSSHDIADAVQREIDQIKASVGAAEAAVSTLRRQG